MGESWSEYDNTPPRERLRRGPDPREQGLDRLVSAGRQLVDGVSGARPGSRAALRGTPSRRQPGERPGTLPRFDQLGRWVEDKLDWILDEDEEWPEPPQEHQGVNRPDLVAQPSPRRRLEAISRRSIRAELDKISEGNPSPGDDLDPWPDDASFSIPRWQRQSAKPVLPSADAPAPQRLDAGRPLPRSTRRRSSNG